MFFACLTSPYTKNPQRFSRGFFSSLYRFMIFVLYRFVFVWMSTM